MKYTYYKRNADYAGNPSLYNIFRECDDGTRQLYRRRDDTWANGKVNLEDLSKYHRVSEAEAFLELL